MAIDPGLLAAYNPTDYAIHTEPPVVARSGEASAEVDALLTALVVQTAAVMTAWNPYSQPLSEVQNRRAQQALVEPVGVLGLA